MSNGQISATQVWKEGGRFLTQNKADPMSPIGYLKSIGILQEDHVCVEPSCSLYEPVGAQERFTTPPVFDSSNLCQGCLIAMGISQDDEFYNLTRVWLESSQITGDLPPPPDKVVDLLNRLAAKVLGP